MASILGKRSLNDEKEEQSKEKKHKDNNDVKTYDVKYKDNMTSFETKIRESRERNKNYITLKFNDNSTINAHEYILSNNSPILDKMINFVGNSKVIMNGNDKDNFTINDDHPESFKMLISMMYYEPIKVTKEMIINFMIYQDYYQLDTMKEIILSLFKGILTIDNVYYIMSTNSNPNIQYECTCFIIAKSVINDTVSYLKENHIEYIIKLISIESSIFAIKLLTKWRLLIKASLDVIEKLHKNIKFHTLTLKQLSNEFNYDDMVTCGADLSNALIVKIKNGQLKKTTDYGDGYSLKVVLHLDYK